MAAYETLLTTVTPARFKVGQMIGATERVRVTVKDASNGMRIDHIWCNKSASCPYLPGYF